MDTATVTAEKHAKRGDDHACLVRIYPPGPGMGMRYPLGDSPLVLGRGKDCDIHLDDKSASRCHAQIQPCGSGHRLIDLESMNGTFVNDEEVSEVKLHDGDYLRIGSSFLRFLSGGNVEAEYHELIYRLTISDALTEIHNHRYLMEFLDREVTRSVRHRRPLAVLMFDVDFFKHVNDQYGHLCGDATLRELVSLMKNTVRRDELLARYGGEEFVLILPETNLEQARALGERLRALVEDHEFHWENESYRVTVSGGVEVTDGDEKSLTSQEFLRRADVKLYQAKREGRNRIVASAVVS